MSKIEKLIKELCPNGVTKHLIKDICNVTRGRIISKIELANNNELNIKINPRKTKIYLIIFFILSLFPLKNLIFK